MHINRGADCCAKQSGRSLLFFAALLLLLIVCCAPAIADEDPSDEAGALLPTTTDVRQAIETPEDGVPSVETNPAAAEGLELSDMDRAEALELIRSVFGQQIEAPAGIYDELQEATLLGSHTAVVSADEPVYAEAEAEPEEEGQADSQEAAPEASSEVEGEESDAPAGNQGPPPSQPGELSDASLLDSTVPLQVGEGPGGSETIDLSLERGGDGFLEPVAPLSQVKVPENLGDGVRLPGVGIAVALQGTPAGASPTISNANIAFYPNVAADSDLAISSTPSGFEALTQLRGPDSPETQTYDLSLPEGAVLEETSDGGAVVRDGEEVLMSVQTPSALDAEGEPVPVELSTGADTVTLTVHPREAVSYPILLDPLYQTYEWATKNTRTGICGCNKGEEWSQEIFTHYGAPPYHMDAGNHEFTIASAPGIAAKAQLEQTAGDHATVLYTVPRYFKESPAPTSYIEKLLLTNMDWDAFGKYPSPYLFMGIWDSAGSNWVSYYTHTGQTEHGVHESNFVYEFNNAAPNSNAKAAEVSINATENTSASGSEIYVGAATVVLGDRDVPQAPVPTAQTQWVNQSAPPLSFTATDTGLGVYAISANTEETDSTGKPLHIWKALNGCSGVGGAACPMTWKSSESGPPPLTYEPSVLPTGIDYISLVAEDPVGNKSASSWEQVKVDHTAPALSLSGKLTEQATVGTKLPEYTLSYSGTDGEDAPAEAQLPGVPTGTLQLSGPTSIAPDGKGNDWVVDKGNSRLEQFTESGVFVKQLGSLGSTGGKLSSPSSASVDPSGNIWVADTGNNRIVGFKGDGSFLIAIGKDVNKTKVEAVAPDAERNFCTAASGNICQAGYPGLAGKPPKGMELNAPQGVAATSGGNIWVTDTGHSRLEKFSPAGAVLNSFVSEGSGAGQLKEPTGIAMSADGSIWVADTGNNRIEQWNSSLAFVSQFGSLGAGSGQFNAPTGLAFAPSGNIFVADRGNNRIQEFRPSGAFLRQFGTVGTGIANLSAPSGVAVAPGNWVWVADKANNRIARWNHADQNPQSGVAKVETKVDGKVVNSTSPGCATKNCTINGSWILDADEYAVGSHKVEVTATDAVGLSTSKTLQVETHGDRTAPAVALSGSMTEQTTLGSTRPAYTLKVSATDPGSAEERKSGVASATIKVDGKVVDSTSPGCPAEGCSITREWTLSSNSYSVGDHTVEATATDAAGRSTTKTLTINIQRDTTAPVLTAATPFYTAPEGWLEQKSYIYTASASDLGGYGVTSLTLKIDGNVVKTTTGTCPEGGCGKSFADVSINMANYAGGAHSAELVATDGAGNTRNKTWTINVDPEGHITVAEAEDTLDAADTTSDSSVVAPTAEVLDPQQIEGGDNPGLVQSGTEITSTGVPDKTTMTTQPGDGFTLQSPEAELTVTPIASESSSDITIAEGVAGVAANVAAEVDSVIRPEYNGALTFQEIRSESSPTQYSWRVNLAEGQILRLANSTQAEVLYASGHLAYLITSQGAHDAVGATVPTSLSVSGNVLTLTVDFRSASFVYPIVAGQGWEGGYRAPVLVQGPEDELEIEEREKAEQEEEEEAAPPPPASGAFTEAEAQKVIASKGVGPEIIPAPEPSASGEASVSSVPEKVVQPNKRCSSLGCGVWWVELKNPSYHYKKNANGRLTAYWQAGTQAHSQWWYPAFYWPELQVDGCGEGFVGPNQVWAGEQMHLTTWARFKIAANAFTFDGDILTFTNREALQIWVWPNGFQQRVHAHWEVTQQWIESGGKCATD
jgi:sugar lactone lactonase YvrE